jgi:hypothetical protein
MSQQPVPILAFAPLRWAAMPAPSRRVLAQLAKTRSVFVLETPEPVESGKREFWELSCGAEDLLVCRPRIAGSPDRVTPETQMRMAQALKRWLDIDDFVAWLYAPSTLPVVQALSPSLVIHDRSFEPPVGALAPLRLAEFECLAR